MSAYDRLLDVLKGGSDESANKSKGIEFILSLHPREHHALFERIEPTLDWMSNATRSDKRSVEIWRMVEYGEITKEHFLGLYKIAPRMAVMCINRKSDRKLGDLINLMARARVSAKEARQIFNNAWCSTEIEYGDFQQAVVNGYKEIFTGLSLAKVQMKNYFGPMATHFLDERRV